MMTSDNPLYPPCDGPPPFDQIESRHVLPALAAALAEGERELQSIVDDEAIPTWESVMAPLEALDDRLDRLWAPVSHLNAVANSESLREVHNLGLTQLNDFRTALGQNLAIYQRVAALHSAGAPGCNQQQRRVIELNERNFRLTGVALPAGERERFRQLSEQLTSLTSRFADQLLDATAAWHYLVEEEGELAGLPRSQIDTARRKAEEAGRDGWLLDLEIPTYLAVMSYAASRSLRREIYTAYTTRASDQGPHAGRFDNGPLIEEILAIRHEQAQLLGFANHVDRVLERRMANSADEVTSFLRSLAERARPRAEVELDELRRYASKHGATERLMAWDIPYWSERLRVEQTSVSQEELRAWFPLERVLDGLFQILNRLFAIRLVREESVAVWHSDVRYYRIIDSNGVERGGIYLDLFARSNKRGGSWMSGCRSRTAPPGQGGDPLATVNCNFAPPGVDGVARLSHDELTTLFHEFGHALHHTLTLVSYPSIAGIHGVEWDAVELPSQLLENWCWREESLSLLSRHVETGEPLPSAICRRLGESRRFQSGMQTLRQLEFALFDLLLHRDYDPARGSRHAEVLDAVRREVAVVDYPEWNRFANSFSHIFAGGYAAGYYSYKWAELLSADAFSLFEERGLLDRDSGGRLLGNILERGGAEEAMALYRRFRGREPTIDALLRQSGLDGEAA